jgi:hypothetical protein
MHNFENDFSPSAKESRANRIRSVQDALASPAGKGF